MTTPYDDQRAISLEEASRQLEQAVHDAQVAYDCIALGHLDRAHTNAITARAAVDSAETTLRAVIGTVDLPLVTRDDRAFGAEEEFGAIPRRASGAEVPETPQAPACTADEKPG
jgi:hypothetical protein